MFFITKKETASILTDFRVPAKVTRVTQLQRYHYEKADPASKRVRLIVKADLDDGTAVVVRMRNEDGVTQELVEAQSAFAATLREQAIETPALFAADGRYAKRYILHGYDVIVTVERFADGELHTVDLDTAQKTGSLLARMHNIAERADLHVKNDVLFDPFRENDLFSFEDFAACEDFLTAVDGALYRDIVLEHAHVLQKVHIFENAPRYAVQGDLSDCNLYRTADGTIGVFDFNRCGDNVLYCDAVMQAIFEARLMDYPPALIGKPEIVLSAFLQGYHRERPFTAEQREAFPYLYALVSAFWKMDIVWDEHSLCRAVQARDGEAARRRMKDILRRLCERTRMPL